MGDKILISYRRDQHWSPQNLYDLLSTHFGRKQILMDVDAPGADFGTAIEKTLKECDLVILLIGPRWLNSTDDQGARRLDNPKDLVRIEIATALNQDIRVIPVLVDGASMPRSRDLPNDLKRLVRQNPIHIHNARFEDGVSRLVIACRKEKLSWLRTTLRALAPLRVHLLVLGLLWSAAHTSQYSDFLATTSLPTQLVTIAVFFGVLLFTTCRLLAISTGINHGILSASFLLGTLYCFLLPGYTLAAFLLLVLGGVLISGYILLTAARAADYTVFSLVPLATFKKRPSPLSFLLSVIIPSLALTLLSLPTIAVQVSAPILLLLGASLWLLILTELQAWSQRLALPLLSLLVLLGFILSFLGWNYHHDVRVLTSTSPLESKDVQVLFCDWLGSRKNADLEPTYPVILVAAEGGGVSAAYATSMVLSGLQALDPTFRQHIFAISGVSGGALGAALFTGFCLAEGPAYQPRYADLPDKVLSGNFLSGPLAALMGPEIFQRLLPMRMPPLNLLPFIRTGGIDRAIALEKRFEQSFRELTPTSVLETDFSTYYDPHNNVPLLFMNATDAESGQRVVFSPARMPGDDNALYPLQTNSSVHLRFSTAAVLSARFPLVSPAGTFDTPSNRTLTLVDGGYVDNTGTETLAALIREITKATPTKPYSLIVLVPKFYRTSLNNGATGIHSSFEFIPILDGLLNSRSQLASSSDKLTLTLQSLPKQIPYACVEFPFSSTGLPLGWSISETARAELKSQLMASEPSLLVRWPLVPINVQAAYLQSVELNQEEMEHYYRGTSIPADWPKYRTLRRVPRLTSMSLKDLPDFIRCDMLTDEHDNLVPIVPKNIVDALNSVARARTAILEQTAESVYKTYSHAYSFSQYDDPTGSNFDRGNGRDLDSYDHYLSYAICATKQSPSACGFDHELMPKYDNDCKTSWTEAKRRYREALTELDALNTDECLKTKSVIKGEINQLEEMYSLRFDNPPWKGKQQPQPER
jgi:predicted acylesterase/phospholipase RssA